MAADVSVDGTVELGGGEALGGVGVTGTEGFVDDGAEGGEVVVIISGSGSGSGTVVSIIGGGGNPKQR